MICVVIMTQMLICIVRLSITSCCRRHDMSSE